MFTAAKMIAIIMLIVTGLVRLGQGKLHHYFTVWLGGSLVTSFSPVEAANIAKVQFDLDEDNIKALAHVAGAD